MSLYYPSQCPHNKRSKFQLLFVSLCRLRQLEKSGIIAVVLVGLAAMSFFSWVLFSTKEAIPCPEECRCVWGGYFVSCSDAGLNNIPSGLPTHVQRLVLNGNNITFLEKDSFVSRGLAHLEILTASSCKIRKIELGAFNWLTKLTYLSLKNNEIIEIRPGILEKMCSLEFLYLGKNIIEHLESDVFSGLVNLKKLSLEGNKLQYLHPDTFVGLPNLQTLYLSNNFGLQILTDSHFINSHSLKHLGISHCNISSVSVETFANVSALEWLDLSYNNLRSLDVNILRALPKLSAIYLHGNPLQCDCQLQEVWRWCQDNNIQSTSKKIAPECDTPSEVKGMWWGVLEKGQCLQDNIQYYGDCINTNCIYTPIEDTDRETEICSFQIAMTVLAVLCILLIIGIFTFITSRNKDNANGSQYVNP